MKTRLLLLSFLLLINSFNNANADPSKFFPVFSSRPYWYNPGALCYDTSHAVSIFGGILPSRESLLNNRIDPKISQAWLFGELKLPKKFGALGIQLGNEGTSIWTKYRMASLTYANGFKAGRGRLGIGVQGDVTNARVIHWWEPNPFPTPISDATKFDLTAGVFYQVDALKTGISVRNILNTPTTFTFANPRLNFSRESYRVINCVSSYKFRLTKDLSLQSSVIAEIIKPKLNLQINNTIIFRNTFHLGASYSSYRINEITINAGIQLGRLNLFAILPIPTTDRFFRYECRAGITFRFSNPSKRDNK